jgi:hypothetical protein
MDEKLKKIQKLLDAAEADLHTARSLMREILETDDKMSLDTKGKAKELSVLEEGKVVEGVFNGQNMIGADEKEYPVPANYASKSKLVEGDTLKLTIGDDGSFMYKQIAPIERRKIIGSLKQSDGIYIVNAEGKDYKVLQASITYYKGEPGDQVTIILPKDHESNWAAVENVIKRSDLDQGAPKPPGEVKSEPVTDAPAIEFPQNKTESSQAGAQPKIENPMTDLKAEDDKDQAVDQGIKELEI